MRRWARRLGVGLLVLVAMLAGLTVVTARRGDPRLYPAAAGAPHIEIFVVSNGYHAGVVLPRAPLAEVAGRDRLAALGAVAARFGAYSALEFLPLTEMLARGEQALRTRVAIPTHEPAH